MQRTPLLEAARTERRRLLQWLLASSGLPLVGISAHAAGTSMASPELPAPIRDTAYRLVKNWDFAATVTDTAAMRDEFFTRFIYHNGQQDFLNDEWQRYRDRDNHVFENGALALVARAPTEVASGKIESGMLRSKWSGQYGYFECRAKVPPGRGMWPAFWLNPQDGKWPPEIDVMEIVNNGRDTTRNSFHFLHSGRKDGVAAPASSRLDQHKRYRPGFDYQDDFHTFAVLWEKDRVRHYVDDVLVVDRAFQWVHRDGSDGGPAHVLVNLAVGGKWPGPPDGAAAFPAKLQLQFIRVWQA